MNQKAIDTFWSGDPELSLVMDQIEQYETWTEKDTDLVVAMDESIQQVTSVIELNMARIGESERFDNLVESMLVLLGFMPAKRALFFLTSFQEYEPFFNAVAHRLNQSPPLQSYAKTLLGRAHLLQQRALQMSINSESNFRLLTQSIEKIMHED